MQPEANDVGALLAILWPALRKAVIDHVIVLDTEGVLDDLAPPSWLGGWEIDGGLAQPFAARLLKNDEPPAGVQSCRTLTAR